jgi:pyruvate/2-oxoglutarate dehydrogenase complex dihydrolipoamide acyltransferase (E2) component
VKVDSADPLAVLAHGKRAGESASTASSSDTPEGTTELRAPLQGTIISLAVKPGDTVRAGQPVLVMEAMKMEHVIEANVGGVVRELAVAAATPCSRTRRSRIIEESEVGGAHGAPAKTSISMRSAPISRRFTTASVSRPTKRGPTRSRAGARRASAPRARTSRICAIRARSRNMPRWWWPGACAATRWKN